MKILLDLTDTVEFVYRVGAITGIQRVVLSALNSCESLKPVFIDYQNERVFDLALGAVDFYTLKSLTDDPFYSKGVTQKEFIDKVTKNLNTLELKGGDTLVLLGGAWNYTSSANFINKLREFNINVTQFVHDMLPFINEELFPDSNKVFLEYFKKLDLGFVTLQTSSEHNKNNIVNFLKPSLPVKVAPFGDEFLELRKSNETNDSLIGLRRDFYALMLGTIEPRKWQAEVIDYWIDSRLYNRFKLMICGTRGWGIEKFDKSYQRARELTENIFLVENIYDDELMYAYKHSSLVIYPSMLEGWGLPISEAKSYGKMCVTGADDSLKHHENIYAINFSKNDEYEIFEKILISNELRSTFTHTVRGNTWFAFVKDILKNIGV